MPTARQTVFAHRRVAWWKRGKSGWSFSGLLRVLRLLDLDIGITFGNKVKADLLEALCRRWPALMQPDYRAELKRQLESMAESEATRIGKLENDQGPTEASALAEIDLAQIVRPERIITPELSAISVPTMIDRGGVLVGRWMLYVRWSDGKRESLPMAESIEVPRSRKLWISPRLVCLRARQMVAGYASPEPGRRVPRAL